MRPRSGTSPDSSWPFPRARLRLARSYGIRARVVDPNPARYYGLVLPAVKYFLEVYAGESYASADSMTLPAFDTRIALVL